MRKARQPGHVRHPEQYENWENFLQTLERMLHSCFMPMLLLATFFHFQYRRLFHEGVTDILTNRSQLFQVFVDGQHFHG